MTRWARALWLLCSTVSAAVIPSVDADDIAKSATSGAGSADVGDSHSLSYLIPCDHCSSNLEHKSSQINLTITAANQECGSENTIFLNGSPLVSTVWHHPIKQWVDFSADSTESTEPSVGFKAYVQLRCLNSDTSIISLSIVDPSQDDKVTDVGLTVSFKQQGQAREIHYETVPIIDIDVLGADLNWGEPESRGGLVREFQELQQIEMALDRLFELHSHQQRRIKDIIMQEFKACDGLYCYLRKAKESTPYLSALIKTLFCHRTMSKVDATAMSDQISLSPNTAYHDPTYKNGQTPSHNQIPEDHHSGNNAFNVTTQPHVYHRPSFFRRHRLPIILSVAATVLILSSTFVLVKAAKGGLNWCIGPRLRRDYAARREERRTRAAYRRAACRQKIRRWWSSLRRPSPTSDYDEKRARILTQEGVLEHAMQGEIAQLERAHEIAVDIVRAEEGRQRMHHQINFGARTAPIYINERRGHLQSIVTNNHNGEGSSTSPGSIGTLPLYSSPPPSYESDLGGEIVVVDGFNYTPSNSDNTSESSVIDCNSRLSFDTDSIGTRD